MQNEINPLMFPPCWLRVRSMAVMLVGSSTTQTMRWLRVGLVANRRKGQRR